MNKTIIPLICFLGSCSTIQTNREAAAESLNCIQFAENNLNWCWDKDCAYDIMDIDSITDYFATANIHNLTYYYKVYGS